MTPRKNAKAKAAVAPRAARSSKAPAIAGEATELQSTAEKPATGFPIVGIGASAGDASGLRNTF